MDDQQQNPKELIKEQIKSLPEDIQSAILSVDYQTKLQEITKRQKLLIDQAGKLELETTLVMIGLEPLADFVSNIQKGLEVTTSKAQEVAKDVSESIFKPIRESLYAINQELEEMGDDVPEEAPQPRLTDSNDVELNREQILSEIEDPSLIKSTLMPSSLPIKTVNIPTKESKEIETLAEVPYQQDIPTPKSSLLETKMAGITITSQQKVQAGPEYKLPETEKKRPTSGLDPYREEIK